MSFELSDESRRYSYGDREPGSIADPEGSLEYYRPEPRSVPAVSVPEGVPSITDVDTSRDEGVSGEREVARAPFLDDMETQPAPPPILTDQGYLPARIPQPKNLEGYVPDSETLAVDDPMIPAIKVDIHSPREDALTLVPGWNDLGNPADWKNVKIPGGTPRGVVSRNAMAEAEGQRKLRDEAA